MTAVASIRERPIVFAAIDVRSILVGAKTTFRSIVSYSSGAFWDHKIYEPERDGKLIRWRFACKDPPEYAGFETPQRCPWGVVGDRLYVREVWQVGSFLDTYNGSRIEKEAQECGYTKGWAPTRYAADGHTQNADTLRDFGGAWGRLRSAHFMPKWASRIMLEITDLRFQKLQAITEKEARAEGISCVPFRPDDGFPVCNGYMLGPDDGTSVLATSAVEAFKRAWDERNGAGIFKNGWAGNPWVEVVTFKRVTP